MRLSLSVLLVTLALCCYEGNAEICPAFMTELKGFLLNPARLYRLQLLKFIPPREAADAKLKVKECVDRLPRDDRKAVLNVVKNNLNLCELDFANLPDDYQYH